MLNRFLLSGLILTAFTAAGFAAGRVTLNGKVTDMVGKPLADATVMIYQARVKTGYSTYCPSCYVDCGRRTVTGRSGAFSIPNLASDLYFDVLVVHDGYTPTFAKKVDPSLGTTETALPPRAPVSDVTRVVRGRVVDAHGQPLNAAVVMPEGVATEINGKPASVYGTVDGLETVAVTNSKGEFELSHNTQASGMLLRVEARGMAPKLIAAPTGGERTTIAVSEGAVIRGRLVHRGKPVAGAEIGLIPQERGGFGMNLKILGNPYEEIRIGSQEDGSFVITNVPAPVEWYIYGKMESIAAIGATVPLHCATAHDGEEVNAGDIEILPGHTLRGRIGLSDGAAIADGMRVTLSATQAWDSQTALIGRDGRFEFVGVPKGKYEIFPSVRRYQMPDQRNVEVTVDKDVNDLAITLIPTRRQ